MTKQELATRIWATANVLRKNIKANEYKDYILGFMFYKYLCDKEKDYLLQCGGESIEELKDADEETKAMFKGVNGYFIEYKDLFYYWKEIGGTLGAKQVSEALERFYKNLNPAYSALFKDIFSALQSGMSKLGENAGSRDKAVRDIVDLVDLIPPTSREYDVLGYIYEYLIQQFSSEAKKDGAFYTPHELTSLMAKIIAERMKGRDEMTAYDPTVGSGGLLLNIGKEVGKYVDPEAIHYYGQELITETANLAKMNLFMQGIPVQNICINNANTLEDDWPYFEENGGQKPLPVDAVVSNPPYSAHWDSASHKLDERFRNYGFAPDTKADYAFVLHCLYHLRKDGVMAIVLPHGVLFRGGTEEEIRKNLINNHNIETIIGFPGQMFFATGIPVIVMILSKEREADDILFIDASQSYEKGKKQNVLRHSDVQRIFDAVQKREDIPYFSRLVTMEEIVKNDWNLNIPRYVSAQREEMPYDLYSVMTGKISKQEIDQFAPFWDKFPQLRDKIFKENDVYYDITEAAIKKIVFDDPDVLEFLHNFHQESAKFKAFLTETLVEKPVIIPDVDKIKEMLFTIFKPEENEQTNDEQSESANKKEVSSLVDEYHVYQAFAQHWNGIDTDMYRIRHEGKNICKETEPQMVLKKDPKTKKFDEEQVGMKGKIFPFDLIKKTYFQDDYLEINRLNDDAGMCASEYMDLWENLDEDAVAALSKDGDDNTGYDMKKLKAAIKKAEYEQQTMQAIQDMTELIDKEKNYRKQVKKMEAELDVKAENKIQTLTDEEVHSLLVQKWVEPVIEGIDKAAESTIAGFVADIMSLQKKYSDPLSELSESQEKLELELKSSLSEMTGSAKDIEAIKMLMEELG